MLNTSSSSHHRHHHHHHHHYHGINISNIIIVRSCNAKNSRRSKRPPDKTPQVVTPSLFCCHRPEPSVDFFYKLALTRTPDLMRPTRRVLTLTDPRTAAKKGYDLGGFCPGGGFGRSLFRRQIQQKSNKQLRTKLSSRSACMQSIPSSMIPVVTPLPVKPSAHAGSTFKSSFGIPPAWPVLFCTYSTKSSGSAERPRDASCH